MSTHILGPYWAELKGEKKLYSAIYFKICLKNDGRANRQWIIDALKSAPLLQNVKRTVLEGLPHMTFLTSIRLITEGNVAGEYYVINKDVTSGEEKESLLNACENILNGKSIKPLVNLSKVMNNLVIKDEELKQPDNSQIQNAINGIRQKLLIDKKIIQQIISSLISGKDILLTGPVGSGKTELATLLPREIWKNKNDSGYDAQVSTATSEWTTQDVIGGIFPKIDDEGTNRIKYEIQKGCVTETVQKNFLESDLEKRTMREIDGQIYRGVWLVIDEFNRANIDRAFGSLFTSLLPGFRVLDIPTTKSGKTSEKQKIPKDYRIIGTLNTADKHFLNDLSFALKRRFNIVNVGLPKLEDIDEEKRIVEKKVITKYTKIGKLGDYKNTFNNLFEIFSFIRIFKKLGTAFPISAFEFILTNYEITGDWDQSLDFALVQQIFPQIEDLSIAQLEIINAFSSGKIAAFYSNFDNEKRERDVPAFTMLLKKLVKYLDVLYPQDLGKRTGVIDGAVNDAMQITGLVEERSIWIKWFENGKIQKQFENDQQVSETGDGKPTRLFAELDLDLNPWNYQIEKTLAPSQPVKGDIDPGKEKWRHLIGGASRESECTQNEDGCGGEIHVGDDIVKNPKYENSVGGWVHAKCPTKVSGKYKIAHTVGEVAPKLPIFTKAIEDLISEKQFTEQSFM